ncbi:hypothetical protein CDL12_25638 [Handroanthus impetiginosus]|uniref:BZIP domain-containing protein n=1 Tax=Handroanthus impetiginosus TaxID=429701 RepID=A0A2G9G997_9LAMI|nr:hypothetical protein CDL12_25638 [Handroanthus impetiginosus]
MGAGEEGTPMKSSRSASSAQEAPSTPTPPAYPDWSSSMQVLYGILWCWSNSTFLCFNCCFSSFSSLLVGKPAPSPLMPPYGTPVPYPALYPPGGVYAHPNMVKTPGNDHGTAELEGKAMEMWQIHASSRAIMGTSGNHSLNSHKTGDGGKTASGSGNDIGSKSTLRTLTSFFSHAECEELQCRVETLSSENHALREVLQRLSEECQKLTSENNSMKGELTEKYGPDILSRLEVSNLAAAAAATQVQFGGDHGN